MGSWDCYCAICGGPFCGVQISKRSKRAQIRLQRQREQGHIQVAEQEEVSQEDDSDSEYGYDPEIISEEDVKWTFFLHVLGFNAAAPGVTKSYISGQGSYDDYGNVNVEPGDDPNFDGPGSLSCYFNHEHEGPVFPFHWCCYELLARVLTGTSDISRINKDLVFAVFHEATEDYANRLSVDYGSPEPPGEQFWNSNDGEEIFASNPAPTPDIADIITAIFASTDFKLPLLYHTLTARVTHDPFEKLPYDVLYRICLLLPSKSILDLVMASRQLYSVLNHNDDFWRQRIKRTMPWFFEVQGLLDNPQIMEGKNMMGLFRWASKETTPRTYMSSPYMSIANRRRIWGVCEQLANAYFTRWWKTDAPASGFIEQMIRQEAVCAFMPIVACPVPNKKDLMATFWIHSWDEVYAQENVLETFWDEEDSLVGISVAPSGQRRLFGRDDSLSTVSKQVTMIEKSEWISGLILHIPEIDLCDASRPLHAGGPQDLVRSSTSPRGITVHFNNGREVHLGQTDMGYSMRPLLASSDLVIVGVEGQVGPIRENDKIISLGLLQAPSPGIDDYTIPTSDFISPEMPLLEKYLWREDYRNILQSRIWASPGIELVTINPHSRESLTDAGPNEIVPHEALIWAKDQHELRSLVRLTGYVIIGGTLSGWDANHQSQTRPIHDLCGIRADFTNNHHEQRRIIGIRKESDGSDWLEEHCVNFDIDGAGGEVVTEISIAQHEAPKAIKLRTNRDREIYWGEEEARNWNTLHAPHGMVLIGIVMSFAKASCFSWETKSFAHTKLSSVSALAMRLE
ncbi:hypothetical protein B7463_g9679, partial [Scytalidium lignicola]